MIRGGGKYIRTGCRYDPHLPLTVLSSGASPLSFRAASGILAPGRNSNRCAALQKALLESPGLWTVYDGIS
jgi:hypothetical protein